MLNDSLPLDRAFAALADPTRRGMLARLSRGPATVSELAAPLAVSLPGVLQHVRRLEASGLVATEKKGRTRTVRLQPRALAAAEGWLARRLHEWETRLDRFEAHLDQIQQEDSE